MAKTSSITVACIVGTRPEAVKMAPVITELASRPESFVVHTISTGQHREMLTQVLDLFGIKPHTDLDIMRPNQTLEDILIQTLSKLPAVLASLRPDIVLVQGDTSTAFISSLCAFYRKISVGHVEAGLRTRNKFEPFPEEINRSLIGRVADLHFAPTSGNRHELLQEGISDDSIFVTGNTVIDALLTTASRDDLSSTDPRIAACLARPTRKILVTAHRRENFGAPLEQVCAAVLRLLEQFPDTEVILPAHPNPLARDTIVERLGPSPRVTITEPLDYPTFVIVQKAAYLILTDSGGVQEEAPSLGKPVLVLRNVTERPEAIAAGTVKIVGTDTEQIVREAAKLLADATAYAEMANAVNPYGDGHASRRIADILLHHFSLATELPEPFIENR